MNTPFGFATRLDDIVFASRNKNYGAYYHRSAYALTLCKSLLFPVSVMCFCGMIFCFKQKTPVSLKQAPQLIAEQSPVRITEVDLNKKNKASENAHSKKDPEPGKKLSTALTVTDNLDTTRDSLPLDVNLDGGSNNKTEANTGNNTGTVGLGSTGSSTTSLKEPVLVADQMPEFEGGLAALYAFISRQIHYPTEAREAMIQGKVSVRFIVDEYGNVILPKAMNRPGYGLDAEAERVVAKLPAFKSPAKIGGEAVKCYFVLPINFKLN